MKLRPWTNAYAELRLYLNNGQDEEFISSLNRNGNKLVFLVSNDFLIHEKTGHTAREFQLILQTPALLRRTTFVFGAYDIYRPRTFEIWEKTGLKFFHDILAIPYIEYRQRSMSSQNLGGRDGSGSKRAFAEA